MRPPSSLKAHHVCLCWTWLMLSVVLRVSEASLFRGAVVMLQPTNSGVDKEMEVSMHVLWERDSCSLETCDAALVNSGNITDEDSVTCHYVQQFNKSDNFINVGFQGGHWTVPFAFGWNIPTFMSLSKRNDTGKINSTPRTVTVPVVQLQERCNHTLKIAVSDPDGDEVRCRWAVGYDECGDVCNAFPGSILHNESCTLSYEAVHGTGYNIVAIMIEDFVPGSSTPLSSVALQFLVYVYSSNEPCPARPEFIPPTVKSGSCIAIPPNATYADQLIAYSGGPGIEVTEIQTVSPTGLSKSPLIVGPEPSLFYMNLTWNPKEEQLNQIYSFCYTALNSLGILSQQSCTQYMVGAYPPSVIQTMLMPIGQNHVHPAEVQIEITFDLPITRTSLEAAILFRDYNTNDVLFHISSQESTEIYFHNDTTLRIIPNFLFPEKKSIYLEFERSVVVGLNGCNPGNEPITGKDFLRFITRDITPPEVVLIDPPSRTNEGVTFKWKINEQAESLCKLDSNSFTNCSNGHFTAFGLTEGNHLLFIQHTDLEANIANTTHEFYVDITSPNVTFLSLPAYISGENNFNLLFICDEHDQDCSYFCNFQTPDKNGNYSPCLDFFLTPTLKNEEEYVFSVYAVDSVNNTGIPSYHNWTVDLIPPSIFINDTNILCSIDPVPNNTGSALVSDNLDLDLEIFFSDYENACLITRTWTVTDDAGNTAHFEQIIIKDFIPNISFIPQVSAPCSSFSGNQTISKNTGIIHNPCDRPLTTSQIDNLKEPSCPGEFNRTWSVSDNCTGQEVTAQQIIKIYDVCPFAACGRNYSPPHGICSEGNCQCNKPWYGDECEILIYEPNIEPNETVVLLLEGQNYDIQPSLSQGTGPIIWSLISAPENTIIDYTTGRVNLHTPPVGNLTFIIKAQNEVGKDEVTFKAAVKATYTAFLDPLPTDIFTKAQPLLLSGTVVHEDESPIRDLFNDRVPIIIDIYNPSFQIKRTLSGYSNQNSKFNIIFHPPPPEYGLYEASARHPSEITGEPQIQWRTLGMRTLHRSILLQGETVGSYSHHYSNITVLINDSPDDLYLIQMQPIPNEVLNLGINLNLTFDKELTVPTLKSGSEITIDIHISTREAVSGYFPIVLESLNGTRTFITVNLNIVEIRPNLYSSLKSIDTIITRGHQKVIGFNVTNIGKISAHNVHVAIPNSFFTLSSFGLAEMDSRNLTLDSQETATGTLIIQIPVDQPLGIISGNFYIQSDEAFTEIQYGILVASDSVMNLTITIEDEYTYYAEGNPLVSDAIVRMTNDKLGIDIHQSTYENNGSTTFSSIPEGKYEILIEAPGHSHLSNVIFVSLETTTITIFLKRIGVSVELVVTPTDIEDRYIITSVADFTANVPMPVVTVTPNDVDLEYFKLGLIDLVEFNITNHGLVNTQDVHLSLPTTHPTLEFIPLVDVPLSLEAKSSVIIPVRITPMGYRKRRWVQAVGAAVYGANVLYSYICGDKKTSNIPIIFHDSHTGSSGVTGIGIGGTGIGGGGGISGSFTGFGILSFISKVFCDKCTGAVLSCLGAIPGIGPKFPGASFVPQIVSGQLPTSFKDILSTGMNVNSEIVNILTHKGSSGVNTKDFKNLKDKLGKGAEHLNRLKLPIDIGICIYNLYNDCYKRSSRKKRSTKETALVFAEAFYPLHLSVLYTAHVLGDVKWLTLNDQIWVTETLRPIFDDTSELGQFVSQDELSYVFNSTNPQNITNEDIFQLISRFNTTQSRWQNGELEPKDEDDNMISYSFLEDVLYDISTYEEKAQGKGFTSYIDAYNFANNALSNTENLEEEAGVCAVVKIQLEQEVTLTREGFTAKLKVDNQELESLENILVNIDIYDGETKEISNQKFSIGALKLSGSLTGIEGNGTLPSESTGTAEWLIIPYSEAAPTTSKRYKVGGSLSYSVDENNIDIILQPAIITVYPDPSLIVHYFWEKNVISDDPFTDEVEPAVPFSLGMVIKNKGFGTAREMKLTSGQPEIIENEKGLLITFELIGATFGNESMNPSLQVDFGDLLPNTTKTVRWWMISSLIGQFSNYNATFENINPLGDPKLSLIDDLQIHELIRNIRIPGEHDDGILDFLVNDIVDIDSNPDRVYSSKDLSYQSVNEGNITSFQQTINSVAITFEITTYTIEAGVIYFSFEDQSLDDLPIGTSFRFIRYVNKLSKSFNVQDLPNENAWVSVRVLGKIRKKKLNFVDFIDTPFNDTKYLVEIRDDLMTTYDNSTAKNDPTESSPSILPVFDTSTANDDSTESTHSPIIPDDTTTTNDDPAESTHSLITTGAIATTTNAFEETISPPIITDDINTTNDEISKMTTAEPDQVTNLNNEEDDDIAIEIEVHIIIN